YFHTKYQAVSWPKAGFECQVNNTHSDWIKTGSLYGLVNIARSPAQDGEWWTQEIIVQGNSVTVLVDGKKVLQYNEPPGVQQVKASLGNTHLSLHAAEDDLRYTLCLERGVEPGGATGAESDLFHGRESGNSSRHLRRGRTERFAVLLGHEDRQAKNGGPLKQERCVSDQPFLLENKRQ